MCAHRVRDPAQQHDRDVALAAFELRDVAFGNAGDFCEHLSRHAAQSAHGADMLAELLEKAGLWIGSFSHIPVLFYGSPGSEVIAFWRRLHEVLGTPARKHSAD